MKKNVEPFLHMLFWLLIFYITYANFGIRVKMLKVGYDFISIKEFSRIFLLVTSIFVGFKMLLFYGNIHYFLQHFFKNPHRRKAFIQPSLFFIITLCLSLSINYFIIITSHQFESKKVYNLLSYSVVMHFLILFIAVAYRLSKDWLHNQITINQLKQEKLQTELDFLKGQINPHFMFNTLNNLYAEARKHEDKTVASGIAKLSHIMRYMIYDSNVEFVDLAKEIQYLESYIELQKLRIAESDPFDFMFNKKNVNLTTKIAPILFIPFVENAFKYGINIDKPGFIHITISCQNEQLYFEIENSKSNALQLEEHSGVGLKNVKRRLELLYQNKHELKVEETEAKYKVVLTLMLN